MKKKALNAGFQNLSLKLEITPKLARDLRIYKLQHKTIMNNYHYKTLKKLNEKDCDQEEFNITLSSQSNISKSHIKNIVEPGIFLDKYKLALVNISYPCELRIKLCTIKLIKAELVTIIDLYIFDRLNLELFYEIVSLKIDKNGKVLTFFNKVEIDFSENWHECYITSNYLNSKIFKQDKLKLTFLFDKKNLWNFISNFFIYADCIKNS